MSEPTPCPLSLCILTEPHAHPSIGDGLFGPHHSAAQEGRGEGWSKVGDTPPLREVKCKCPCGATFTGVAFFAKPGPDGYVQRTCNGCADATAARLTAKTEATRTPRKPQEHVRDAAPLRTAYKDD